MGFLLRWDTVFLRMIPEAQAAYGERALLHMLYEQITDSGNIKREMWVIKSTKPKHLDYSRIQCIEW